MSYGGDIMKKSTSIFILVIGVVLLIVGLFLQVPSKELTTYSTLEGEYSVIEEYVGGDAYNYIIGASLVSGEIAGAKTQKAIFISIGLLIICFGLYALSHIEKNNVLKATTDIIETENNVEEQNDIDKENIEEIKTVENEEIITKS